MKVTAIDIDDGANGEVRYELAKGNGGIFRVDRKSGEVIMKQSVQSTKDAFSIVITAYDRGAYYT